MNKQNILWVMECLLLRLSNCTKEEMIKLGASEQLAENGIKLCEYPSNKEFNV